MEILFLIMEGISEEKGSTGKVLGLSAINLKFMLDILGLIILYL